MYREVRILSRSLPASRWYQLRSVAQLNVKSNNAGSKDWTNAKPFSEIPGPTILELIRGFLPGGSYYKKTLAEATTISHSLYGDLYKIPGVFGMKGMLLCFNVDDLPTLLRCEGEWPKRRVMETMVYHRKVLKKEDLGDVIGLFVSNGEAWGKLRTAVNPILMQPRNARLYLNKMLEVNDEFLQRIREIRDPNTLEMPETFEDELNRMTFESVAVVALNQQIGLIRKDRNNEEAQKLFKSIRSVFDLGFHLEIAPSLWRIIKTPKFKQLIAAYDTIYDVTMKYINQALERIENDKSPTNDKEEQSVLEKLLKIDKRIAVVMAMDMLMNGVDTASSALTGILLCIAKNPEKQERLRQELLEIMPEKDSALTMDNMKNLPYLRACIKEGLRMYPITSGVVRKNNEDIILSGYQVPKEQDLVVNTNLLLREERFYSKPNEFIPERWLRNEKNDFTPMNPFLFIPFGFGARSCIGKRIVEMEMEIAIARLVRNFNLEFNYPTENAFKSLLINVPAIPLKFKFSDVKN